MDLKAKKILFDTYWSSKGWKDNPTTANEDFEYAKSKGLMFDNLSISHDDCIKEVKKLVSETPKKKITDAFLSSLSTRRLDWRSALGSYSNALKFDIHDFDSKISTEYMCNICGGYDDYVDEDLNVLNFERIKWGGVRHDSILYNLLDLQIFMTLEIPTPTESDFMIFNKILEIIDSSQFNDYPSQLEKNISGELSASKDERRTLLEILSCCGILKPKSYDRPYRGSSDWHFIEYWRGQDKYDINILKFYFGSYSEIKF
jgi:hypothetical protein